MNLTKTEFQDLYIIQNNRFQDTRGDFTKVFQSEVFKNMNLENNFKESFFSTSQRNVIRGMHFQTPPYAHAKLVYVNYGEILDVVLDIRTNSSTFGKYYNVNLSSTNALALYIPTGFAHGFLTLSETAVVTYLTTTVHTPSHDNGIKWDSFGFDWKTINPIMSERDQNFESFQNFKNTSSSFF